MAVCYGLTQNGRASGKVQAGKGQMRKLSRGSHAVKSRFSQQGRHFAQSGLSPVRNGSTADLPRAPRYPPNWVSIDLRAGNFDHAGLGHCVVPCAGGEISRCSVTELRDVGLGIPVGVKLLESQEPRQCWGDASWCWKSTYRARPHILSYFTRRYRKSPSAMRG
jgi:hypothetical protein